MKNTDDKLLEVGPIAVSDGPQNPSLPLKQNYVKACAVCPQCGKDMLPKGKQDNRSETWPEWECPEHGARKENEVRYHIRYSIGKEIVTPRGKTRAPGQLTTEAQKNQRGCLDRAKELRKLAEDHAEHIPSQRTYMSVPQCRLGESLFRLLKQKKQSEENAIKAIVRFFEKFETETLEIAVDILLAGEGKVAPTEMREFVREFGASKLDGTPVGLIKHARATKWKGNKCEQTSLIEALMKAIEFASNNMSPERKDHLLTLAYYIAGRFQPDPSVFVPASVLLDFEVRKWCLYDYAEEQEQWKKECNRIEQINKAAEERGEPPKPFPLEPIELIDVRYKPHPTKPGAFFVVKSERPRPWTYSEAKTMIAEVRYLKTIMASPSLNGAPAAWCDLPGKDLVMPTGGIWGKRKKEQLAQRMLLNRIFTSEEKQGMLDESLEIDGGMGAASVLWQGWGGGRKEDVEKYCTDNFVWEDNQIRIGRDQNKNGSFKVVTAMMNFYYMAFFLMKTNRWNTECFERGYMDTTRKRIATKVGFWEESWADSISITDQMPNKNFAYAPFEPDLDFPDVGRLLEFLRKPSPIRDLILNGMSDDDVQRILHCPSPAAGVSEMIAIRLNDLMAGPLLYETSLFPDPNHPPRDRAIHMMKTQDISAPNLRCLNRWLLEDALRGLVNSRQNYPRNALRRSGITGYCLLYEDTIRAAKYFSSGKKSVEIIYNCPAPKQYSRDHWTMCYTAMSNSIGTDRAHLLPPDHKLDDFRKPEVIAIESKICKDAAAFEKRVEDKPKRRKGYSAQNPKFTPDERIALIAEFKKRISSGEKLTMKVYATEKNMGLTTLTTMLQAVGFGKQRSREEIDLLVEEFKKEAEKGVSLKEFSAKKAIPYHTLHKDLNAAGLCEKRRSVDEILELLDQLSASGLTDEEFATQIGIHRETLRIWKSKAARNTLGKQNDCRADAKNRREKETAIIADYQHCKEKDANITPRKFSKLRNIPYSTLRSLFAKAGGLLASVKRHSRDEIRRIVQEFNEARQNNPGLKREEFALKHGITIDTLNCWLSGGFRELLFDQKQVPSSNNGGDNKCSPMDQTGR